MRARHLRKLSGWLVALSALASPAEAGVGPDALAPRAPAATRAIMLVTTAGPVTIAPVNSNPHRKSYAQWAADWWQWALETRTSENPLIDTTGAKCKVGQRGYVWFLAGAVSPDYTSRTCEVPAGSALFFPLVNNFYGASKGDPLGQKTEAFCRTQVESTIDPANVLTLRIDGVALQGLRRQAVRSVLFDVQLPPENIFGLVSTDPTDRLVSPSCDAGYYVFLSPLPIGWHTVRWRARRADGNVGQDILYRLHVK